MRLRIALMGFSLLMSSAAWGQESSWVGQEQETAKKPISRHQHPYGVGLSRNRDDRASMVMQTPEAASIRPPLVFSGAQAGNVIMAYSGDEFSACPSVPVGNWNSTAATTRFSVNIPNISGSTYVDVMFTTNLNFYPVSNAMGVAVDCRVEQDLDSTGNYSTSYYCSGISDSIKPWLAFEPSTASVGSAFQTTFRGYAPVVPLVTSGANAGLPAPTRVVVKLIAIEWAAVVTGAVYSCNNTLKIEY